MSGGSTVKGQARRVEIVHAARDLLVEGGPAAVTARGVATRAGVPLASTMYYFRDIATLLAEVAETLAEEDLDAARALAARAAPGTARSVASLLVTMVHAPQGRPQRDRVLARFETSLAAAGPGALAGVSAGRSQAQSVLVARVLRAAGRDPSGARAVLALVDGAVLGALLHGGARPLSQAGSVVAAQLDRIAPPMRRLRRVRSRG